jgi:sulfite dehydrogenase
MSEHSQRRRRFLKSAVATGAGLISRTAWAQERGGMGGSPAPEMARFPEKADLILLTDRPPNLEMPAKYFREDLTPNDAFFVRWHLGNIPTSVDPATFRLGVAGHVDEALSLSLADLRKNFEAASVVAVCQCSGNSRALYEPRVAGGQWQNGAVGNARWTGVRLGDLLKKAKLKAGAVDVSVRGLDRAPMPTTPDFVKSLAIDKANEADVIVAYEMNGKELPMLNGYPLRLVVPGWYATYWVKALSEINVLPQKFKGFWMEKAYRVPNNPDCQESPKELAKETVPITRMTVRALFAAPEAGERVAADKAYEVQGVAMDGGKGIAKVEVSADAGATWAEAKLDPEIGKYSWRRWRYSWTPATVGRHVLKVRATNAAGEGQTLSQWNRSGYARNVVESVEVTVA